MDNNLPNGNSNNNSDNSFGSQSNSTTPQNYGNINKEHEPVVSKVDHVEKSGLIDNTKEIELPKEVDKSGIKVIPQKVNVPRVLQDHGLQPSGFNSFLGMGTTITLPLTDDQIATGLHNNPSSSIRWLAEWCIKKLKQLHISIKMIHGKIVRQE